MKIYEIVYLVPLYMKLLTPPLYAHIKTRKGKREPLLSYRVFIVSLSLYLIRHISLFFMHLLKRERRLLSYTSLYFASIFSSLQFLQRFI